MFAKGFLIATWEKFLLPSLAILPACLVYDLDGFSFLLPYTTSLIALRPSFNSPESSLLLLLLSSL